MLIAIKILTWIASPLGLLCLGGLAAVILLLTRRLRWLAVSLLTISVGQVVVFSFPIVADQLTGALEDRARALAQNGQRAQKILAQEKYAAIVLLGGATTPASPPRRPDPELNDAADRIWHAARLYQQGLAPKVIVSGGKGVGLESRKDIQTEAQAMRLLLVSLGVPPAAIVLEEDSRNTRENAAYTKKLLGDQPIALVTSAFHMPRAIRTFEKAGMRADAFPTDFRATPEVRPLWEKLLPDAGALEKTELALKEYIALMADY